MTHGIHAMLFSPSLEPGGKGLKMPSLLIDGFVFVVEIGQTNT